MTWKTSEQFWSMLLLHLLLQTQGKFMKFVLYTLSDGIESRPISNQKIGQFQEKYKEGRNWLSYAKGRKVF